MMKISWLSYQQGSWLFAVVTVTSVAFATASGWGGQTEADLHVAAAGSIILFLSLVHFLRYYVSLGEGKTLVVRNGRSCHILSAREFVKVQPIRGYSFAVVSATGKTFGFVANPLAHYTSSFLPEHEWAAELTQRIQSHLT